MTGFGHPILIKSHRKLNYHFYKESEQTLIFTHKLIDKQTSERRTSHSKEG